MHGVYKNGSLPYISKTKRKKTIILQSHLPGEKSAAEAIHIV
jgi:hypothetical protein